MPASRIKADSGCRVNEIGSSMGLPWRWLARGAKRDVSGRRFCVRRAPDRKATGAFWWAGRPGIARGAFRRVGDGRCGKDSTMPEFEGYTGAPLCRIWPLTGWDVDCRFLPTISDRGVLSLSEAL